MEKRIVIVKSTSDSLTHIQTVMVHPILWMNIDLTRFNSNMIHVKTKVTKNTKEGEKSLRYVIIHLIQARKSHINQH